MGGPRKTCCEGPLHCNVKINQNVMFKIIKTSFQQPRTEKFKQKTFLMRLTCGSPPKILLEGLPLAIPIVAHVNSTGNYFLKTALCFAFSSFFDCLNALSCYR